MNNNSMQFLNDVEQSVMDSLKEEIAALEKKESKKTITANTPNKPKGRPIGGVNTRRIFLTPKNYNAISSNYIAIDVETTGLNRITEDIIEVGAVRFADGKQVDSFSTLIKIGRSIPFEISALTGITNDMLYTYGQYPRDAYEELATFLGNACYGETVICAHNAHFDIGFIAKAFRFYHIEADLVFLDTCTLARRTIKGLDNYKQETVLSYYNIVQEKTHRALSDAKACGEMMKRLLDDNEQFKQQTGTCVNNNVSDRRTMICPECGSPMVKRVARRGARPGKAFWGCSNYPRCKCIINMDDSNNIDTGCVGDMLESSVISYDAKKYEKKTQVIDYKTIPFEGFDYMESYCSVGVSSALLQKLKNGRIDAENIGQYSNFRLDYSGVANNSLNALQRQICSLALRFLCRGIVTINSNRVEQSILKWVGRTDYLDSDFNKWCYRIPKSVLYPFDSSNEKFFAELILPAVLGPDWQSYTESQVLINSIIKENGSFIDQRVDFLISNGTKDIIIELDGPEHNAQKEKDQERNRVLSRNGFKVIRITNDTLHSDQQGIIEQLSKEIAVDQKPLPKEENYACEILLHKSIHQTEIAILAGIINGYIEKTSSIRIDCYNGCPIDEASFTKLILKDLKELLDEYCDLYDIEHFFECTETDNDVADSTISFGRMRDSSGNTILITDLCINKTVRNNIMGFSDLHIANASENTLLYFLNYCFRFSRFREGQFVALSRLLEGKDSIVLLPTGSGKSLIYQLASLLVPGKIIVVEPLISLMDDQIYNLHCNGVDCAVTISSGNKSGLKEIANSAISIIYVSPERLQLQSFRDNVETIQVTSKICTVAIDEAHCVSEWGHDFRTSYLNIGRITRTVFGFNGERPTLIALTGTASTAVLKDVKRELGINEYDAIITPETFNREELHFKVVHSRSGDKERKLKELLSCAIPEYFGKTPGIFYSLNGESTNGGIIFCPHVNGSFGVLSVNKVVNGADIVSDIYSGEEPKYIDSREWEKQKKQAAKSFKQNKINTLVSTKAFGMGIDKPNVRFTVHYGIPSSIEAFYQEAGRAGRGNDVKDALCTIIISDENKKEDDYLLNPVTSLNEIRERIEAKQYGENDDISRMLWFHVRSFKGVEIEMSNVEKTLQYLFEDGKFTESSVRIKYGKNSIFSQLEQLQKAVQRLLVLGIVSDYTVDYSKEEITLFPGSSERILITSKFADYVRGYNEGRVATEIKKLNELETKTDYEFDTGAARVLTEFIYDTIEKGRRRGLREIRNAAVAALNSPTPDDTLRQRVVRYFETTYADELNLITDDKSLGFDIIPMIINGKEMADSGELVGGIRSASEASGLRGGASRYLESTPDHPGLLATRALAEILCKDYNTDQIQDDIAACCNYAVKRYSCSENKLAEFLLFFMEKALERDANLFYPIVESICDYCDVVALCEELIDSVNLGEEEKAAPAELYFGHIAKRIVNNILSMKGEE